jgi:hypothetical protein
MRRMTLAAPLAIVFLLATGASCDSKSDNAGPAPEFSSVATATATPGATSSPAKQATSTPPAAASWPTPENCVSYNPGNLTKFYEAGIHMIRDGNKDVLRLTGGPGDIVGEQGIALAKRYKKVCFLGKGNTREESNEFVFEYWRDSSGNNVSIPDENCGNYDKNNLTVENMGGGDGWRVLDHNNPLQLFNNETDARNGKLVLQKYSKICRIGDADDNGVVVSYFP